MFKLERERPALSLYQNQLFYIKDKFLRIYDYSKSHDSPVIAIRKTANALTPLARILSYNPAEHSVLICFVRNPNSQTPSLFIFIFIKLCFFLKIKPTDGGVYELHNLPRDMSGEARVDASSSDVRKGTGHSAVFVGRNRFAVFDKKAQVYIFF